MSLWAHLVCCPDISLDGVDHDHPLHRSAHPEELDDAAVAVDGVAQLQTGEVLVLRGVRGHKPLTVRAADDLYPL